MCKIPEIDFFASLLRVEELTCSRVLNCSREKLENEKDSRSLGVNRNSVDDYAVAIALIRENRINCIIIRDSLVMSNYTEQALNRVLSAVCAKCER